MGAYANEGKVAMRCCPCCGVSRPLDWYRTVAGRARGACWKCRALRLDEQGSWALEGDSVADAVRAYLDSGNVASGPYLARVSRLAERYVYTIYSEVRADCLDAVSRRRLTSSLMRASMEDGQPVTLATVTDVESLVSASMRWWSNAERQGEQG